VKMIFAALVAGISLYIPMKLLDQLVFDTTRVVPLIALTGTATFAGMTVYLFLTWVLDIEELKSFIGLIRRIGQTRQIFKAPAEVLSTGETHG
ncbi:MAG: hypothetical protein AAB506_00225, partial [Patescibacteria group bacterium]